MPPHGPSQLAPIPIDGDTKVNKILPPDVHDVHSDVVPPLQIVWRNVALFAYLHLASALGLYYILTGQAMWQTCLWTLGFAYLSTIGVTGGAHRLWAHKAYKANLPLRIILAFLNTAALQNSIWEWSRDHRLHHKYTETHADPHSAKRGFFFSHMGWLLVRKHPCVKEKGKTIDMSDLDADPVVMFQKRYYVPLAITATFVLPSLVPWYFWGEKGWIAYCTGGQLRYLIQLHGTWCVNSVAHMWGDKPYDKNINPAENKWVGFFGAGEGWHNYHHTFPWDYKAAELGNYRANFTTAFIDFFAKLGWAYDLKTVSPRVISDRVGRTGDGTHVVFKTASEIANGEETRLPPAYWGDEDIPQESVETTKILYPEASSTKSKSG